MTEEEWLACGDPIRMLNHLRQSGSHTLFEIGKWIGLLRQNRMERRLRLYACACMRHVWERLAGPGDKGAVELAEEYVEGRATLNELVASRERLESFTPICVTEQFASQAAASAASEAADLFASHWLDDPRRPDVLRSLADLLRDIFGNPFRPITFSPSWRTDTAVALARQMYESRDFGAMPILADALQDAGCEEQAILGHCRDATTPHVRGCWVVDLVLGKE